MNNHMLVRRTRWDDDDAKLVVWWELYHYVKNWRGKWRWRQKTYTASSSGGNFEIGLHGDEAWANKIAKHYGIEIMHDEATR